MDSEEALYAAVGEELRQGQIRQGLWAKALAEEGYDEQRAKAKYLKLRVRSLRNEIADAEAQERLRVREQQKQQREQAMQGRLHSLEWEFAQLTHLQKSRSRIQFVGFWLAFAVGTATIFLNLNEGGTGVLGRLFLAAMIGLLGGVAGFVLAEVTRWFIPSQRELSKREADLKAQREQLKRAKMTGLQRFNAAAGDMIGIIIVLLCHMAYRALH